MKDKKSVLHTDDTIKAIYRYDAKKKVLRPLIGMKIPAGFPSPAQDYIEDSLDLNEYLIPHPASTYFVRVDGDSMVNAGIYPDDILIVDRSLEASHNRVVIAFLDGELTVKRLQINNGRYLLVPDNKAYPSIQIEDWMEMTIWGVVSYVIHKV
ncbi:MAG: translesion error-prone DNA polymerase V autoproteolytic subunit [Candidatus Cloacimonetes bacterium]|nr:translesion error-prone DNA polymerase V autoproteolytic subunit [Candidatus Cloacimonadota bacterium]